jgi:hypothetical protein
MIVLHSLDTYLWKCPCATLGRGCSGAGGVQGNPNPRCPSGRNTKWARPSLTQEVVPDPCTYDTTHLVRPPRPPYVVKTLTTINVETGPKFQKHQSNQTLREDVRELGGHRHVQNADITDGNAFPDEVEVNLDMLCTLMLNGVGGEVDGADVVAVDKSSL